MRAFRNLLLFTVALSLAACSDDEGGASITDIPPLAYTRFVHAVPDTGGTDWRFTDILEYSPVAFGMTYRGFTPYQGTQPGTRTLRIFSTSEDIEVTSNRMVDTTLTFEAGVYYTIVHTGYADPGAGVEDRVVVYVDDIPPTIADGEYALRAVHQGVGWGPIDVYAPSSTSAALPGSALFTSLDYTEASAYTTMALGNRALRALPAGQPVPLMTIANTSAPAGAAGDEEDNLTPIGGTGIGGSAISGFFTPGSVIGSSAPQSGAFVASATHATLAATATGFTIASGRFNDLFFFVGQEIVIDRFDTPANNGTAVITGITNYTRTSGADLGTSAAGYTRSTGSFVTDGYTVGMPIYVTGFDSAASNGAKTVTAVTATLLSVGQVLDVEEEDEGRVICANPCSEITVTKTGGTTVEVANGDARIRGPRPAWVYIVDRHPR